MINTTKIPVAPSLEGVNAPWVEGRRGGRRYLGGYLGRYLGHYLGRHRAALRYCAAAGARSRLRGMGAAGLRPVNWAAGDEPRRSRLAHRRDMLQRLPGAAPGAVRRLALALRRRRVAARQFGQSAERPLRRERRGDRARREALPGAGPEGDLSRALARRPGARPPARGARLRQRGRNLRPAWRARRARA